MRPTALQINKGIRLTVRLFTVYRGRKHVKPSHAFSFCEFEVDCCWRNDLQCLILNCCLDDIVSKPLLFSAHKILMMIMEA